MTVSALHYSLECSSDNSLECLADCASYYASEWTHYFKGEQGTNPRNSHGVSLAITRENVVLSIL